MLYDQITAAMAPYLTDEKLKMILHSWSTQLNEALNNSVQAYVSKIKNFSGTISLKTRVGIAAGVMAVGYHQFWTRVFSELDLEMDTKFTSSLLSRDKKKESKRKKQKSKEGKVVQRTTYLAKFDQAHKEQMNNSKTGKIYCSGVALSAAKKTVNKKLTASNRNPKGTPKELMRCAY